MAGTAIYLTTIVNGLLLKPIDYGLWTMAGTAIYLTTIVNGLLVKPIDYGPWTMDYGLGAGVAWIVEQISA
ncbi:MAG: hypothetical protein ACTHMI_24465 [Mucilaginibacter sp.]